jgi:hypothetical protein
LSITGFFQRNLWNTPRKTRRLKIPTHSRGTRAFVNHEILPVYTMPLKVPWCSNTTSLPLHRKSRDNLYERHSFPCEQHYTQAGDYTFARYCFNGTRSVCHSQWSQASIKRLQNVRCAVYVTPVHWTNAVIYIYIIHNQSGPYASIKAAVTPTM